MLDIILTEAIQAVISSLVIWIFYLKTRLQQDGKMTHMHIIYTFYENLIQILVISNLNKARFSNRNLPLVYFPNSEPTELIWVFFCFITPNQLVSTASFRFEKDWISR